MKETITNQTDAMMAHIDVRDHQSTTQLMDVLKNQNINLANISNTLSLVEIKQYTDHMDISNLLNQSIAAICLSETSLREDIRDYSKNTSEAMENFHESLRNLADIQQAINNSMHDTNSRNMNVMMNTLQSHQSATETLLNHLSNKSEEVYYKLSSKSDESLSTLVDHINALNASILKSFNGHEERMVDLAKSLNESDKNRHIEEILSLTLIEEALSASKASIVDISALISTKASAIMNHTNIIGDVILTHEESGRNDSLTQTRNMYQKGEMQF